MFHSKNHLNLIKEEERITKKKALSIFLTAYLDNKEVGTFKTLSKIHNFLFEDIYEFAGKLRNVNISKGNFRFIPIMYLQSSIDNIEKMP